MAERTSGVKDVCSISRIRWPYARRLMFSWRLYAEEMELDGA